MRVAVLAPATALCECCTRFKDAGGPTLLMLRCGAGEASARTRGGCRRGGGAMWSLRRLRRRRTPRTMTGARWVMREGVDDARWRGQEKLTPRRCHRRRRSLASGGCRSGELAGAGNTATDEATLRAAGSQQRGSSNAPGGAGGKETKEPPRRHGSWELWLRPARSVRWHGGKKWGRSHR